MQKTPSVRPDFFDWVFAICLSLAAAAVVFPTTCFGSIMLVNVTGPILHPGPSGDRLLAGLFVYGLLTACIGLTIYSAVWAARFHLKTVRKTAAESQEPESQEH